MLTTGLQSGQLWDHTTKLVAAPRASSITTEARAAGETIPRRGEGMGGLLRT